MNIVLFGATNPTGSAFLDITQNCLVHVFGRKSPTNLTGSFTYCDLSIASANDFDAFDSVLVSFAPIWLFSSFIHQLHHNHPHQLTRIRGIIACSSSSYLTKRFAFNDYDKKLTHNLSQAHDTLIYICSCLEIPLQILAPTLVYGCVNEYSDKNITKILKLMQKLPFIFLPIKTGFRQPIHAQQLAFVAFFKSRQMYSDNWSLDEPKILPLGGDSILTYRDMILSLISSLDPPRRATICRVVSIPDRLYYLLVLPMLVINPKLFEALLRMKSNLSDFVMVHQILGESPQEFPVAPFFFDDCL